MRKLLFAAFLAASAFLSLAITVAADGPGGWCC
jgi:hypothetical protein